MSIWWQVWTILLHGILAQAVIPWPGAPVLPPPLSGMLVWYQAGSSPDCSGSPCTNGAAQNNWTDLSGNGNTGIVNGTRKLSTAGPVCTAPTFNTNQINGKPALTFNGTTDCFGLSAGSGVSYLDIMVFAVVKETVGESLLGSNSTGFNYQLGATQAITKACTTAIATSNTSIIGSWVQINAYLDNNVPFANPWAFRLNRAADGSGTTGTTVIPPATGLGGNGCSAGALEMYSGQIAEFLLYNRVLSSTEITTVETYLNSRYGL